MYFEEENKRNSKQGLVQKRKKQKQATMLISLLIIGGLAFYFLSYLPEEKVRAKEEIAEMLKENWQVTVDKLDKNLWADSESWEEYLEGLFLPSQVQGFKEKILNAIDAKAIELEQEEKDKPRKEREKAIKDIEDLLEEREKDLPDIQKFLEQFKEKVNNTPINDLSSVTKKASDFIFEKRYKRKRLYWLLPAYNWADRWLLRNKQSLNSIWEKMGKMFGEEPNYFDAKAIYRIQFPPSLWNNLTEEQKTLAQQNGHGELTLREEVKDYKFSPLIEEWEQKAKIDPVRGELNPNDLSQLDNNALFYGAPRTGKSIMAEKLAYEVDVYPLVAIQGSTLTVKKPQDNAGLDLMLKFFFTVSSITYDLVEDYGFERVEDGEVRYILFLDEADQVCTTTSLPPSQASSQLTFLKECMGSDNKSEESKNLWIAATNHLDSINIAIYQAGRLSNPLSFSWTLGEFIHYSDDAGISSQFPQHWTENKVLKDEDNQWVNRFNKIIFDKDFLPFWNKFISSNPNAEYEPEKDDDQTNQPPSTSPPKKTKIKWGEFFEFFWRLYDSKQLENFEGKFENPRTPKLEEVLEQTSRLATNKISKDISEAIDNRLKELNEAVRNTNSTIQSSQGAMNSTLSRTMEEIKARLQEIGGNMGRSSSYY